MNSTLIHLLHSSVGFFFYKHLNLFLQKYQNKKLANNSTSFFHALTSSLLGVNYLLNNGSIIPIKFNSTGYFTYDIINIIQKNKFSFTDLIYIYHHLASHWYMSLDPLKYQWVYVLTWAEISNLPGYIVYYNIQKDKQKNLWKGYKSFNTKCWMRIQLYVYLLIRTVILTFYSYRELLGPNPKPVYFCAPVYLLGLIWTYVIYQQNQTFSLQHSLIKSSKPNLL